MTQEPPPLLLPSEQRLPPIPAPQSRKEPMLPLPLALRRLVLGAIRCPADRAQGMGL